VTPTPKFQQSEIPKFTVSRVAQALGKTVRIDLVEAA
jgi:hypothetical protein